MEYSSTPKSVPYTNPDRCFFAVFSHVFWSKLLSKNLGDSVEEGGRDGREEDVGEDVDDGGGHGEGGEQEAGVLRLGCWGCGCQLGTIVERQLKGGHKFNCWHLVLNA